MDTAADRDGRLLHPEQHPICFLVHARAQRHQHLGSGSNLGRHRLRGLDRGIPWDRSQTRFEARSDEEWDCFAPVRRDTLRFARGSLTLGRPAGRDDWVGDVLWEPKNFGPRIGFTNHLF